MFILFFSTQKFLLEMEMWYKWDTFTRPSGTIYSLVLSYATRNQSPYDISCICHSAFF